MNLIKRFKNIDITKNAQKDASDFTDNTRLFRLNKFISTKQNVVFIAAAFAVVTFFLLNYATNIIFTVIGTPIGQHTALKVFSPINIFKFDENLYGLYIFFILLTGGTAGKLVYDIRTSFNPLNVGQKGSSRWATRDEIRAQYKVVPEKTEGYKGGGGVIIAREKDEIFIDDSPVNNLVIGITRSGKGEMFVFPTLDIYSRAEKQPSLIITDPKLELAGASIDTLTERGYKCYVLNLIDPDFSMNFNPLQLILDAYKKGDFAEADLLCNTLCYSIFNGGDSAVGGDAEYWANSSSSLLSGLILANIEDCIKLDKQENEERYVAHIESEERKKNEAINNVLEAMPWEEREKYNNIRDIIEAKQRCNDIDETDEQTIAEMQETIAHNYGIPKYTVRELWNTSLPELEIDYVSSKFEETHENEKKVNLCSVIQTFADLGMQQIDESKSLLDIYFNDREMGNKAKAKFSGTGLGSAKTKGNVYSNTLAKIEIFRSEKIAKMTAQNSIDLKEVGFGVQPVAIFLGIPDYDASNHFIASVFIRQLYFVLAKTATHAPNGKCYREVVFMLDEFGNLPPIEGMANIITVCLGRNIRFNLIIQAYSQIEKLYGKDADTIIGNCGNQIYILTNDKETAEHYSQLIGSETFTEVQRSGDKLALKKSFTEIQDSKPLLNMNELMELRQGECIVKRVMKRTDNKGNDIIPRPIKNTGEHRLKYRYEYLSDEFQTGTVLYESDNSRETKRMIAEIEARHGTIQNETKLAKYKIEQTKDIDMKSRIFDYNAMFATKDFEELLIKDELTPFEIEIVNSAFSMSDGRLENKTILEVKESVISLFEAGNITLTTKVKLLNLLKPPYLRKY